MLKYQFTRTTGHCTYHKTVACLHYLLDYLCSRGHPSNTSARILRFLTPWCRTWKCCPPHCMAWKLHNRDPSTFFKHLPGFHCTYWGHGHCSNNPTVVLTFSLSSVPGHAKRGCLPAAVRAHCCAHARAGGGRRRGHGRSRCVGYLVGCCARGSMMWSAM